MIIYRELLKKYIDHIGQNEGIDYLGKQHDLQLFTKEEWEELVKLSDEVNAAFYGKNTL